MLSEKAAIHSSVSFTGNLRPGVNAKPSGTTWQCPGYQFLINPRSQAKLLSQNGVQADRLAVSHLCKQGTSFLTSKTAAPIKAPIEARYHDISPPSEQAWMKCTPRTSLKTQAGRRFPHTLGRGKSCVRRAKNNLQKYHHPKNMNVPQLETKKIIGEDHVSCTVSRFITYLPGEQVGRACLG